MRNEISWIEGEIERYEMITDISKLSVLANQFYNLCTERNNTNKSIINLFTARTCFESCITMLKIIIEPENNSKIKKLDVESNLYHKLETYFENFMSILDLEQKDLEKNVKELKSIIDPFAVIVGIKTYREKLVDYMNNLIILPLYNACNVYNNLTLGIKDQTTIHKEELFTYLLFREVMISAKIKGSEKRQKIKISSGEFGSRISETNIIKNTSRRRIEPREEVVEIPPAVTELDEFLEGKFEEDTEDEEEKDDSTDNSTDN